jgi:hypothetical protein
MNIRMDGDKLLIEVDCSPAALKSADSSKSGKTRIVATTSGFTGFATKSGGQVRVGLNVTVPR